ncbi:MAG: acyl-CoA dehydrogenase family protein [Ferroplasma sp.]
MDDTFALISSSYGKNHFDIDLPFQNILDFYYGKHLDLSELGSYAGKELYEATDYIDKLSSPQEKMWGITDGRIDSILISPMEKSILKKLILDFGINRPYAHGRQLMEHYAMGYLVADPGIYCIITLTNQTLYALHKYGNSKFNKEVKALSGDGPDLWLGATWFTERQGGSDLGANDTQAVFHNGKWLLTGDKYFASNAGLADISLISAFHDGNKGARNLSIFALKRKNDDNALNYRVRRLKEKSATKSVPSGEVELDNSEAIMLGDRGSGIYYITEDLMVSRLDNAAAACGIARKAYLEAYYYSQKRMAFGKYLISHPGVKKDLLDMEVMLEGSLALTFKSIKHFQQSIESKPPYDDDYNYTRLLTHIVKNLTADSSASITKNATELHGGIGFLSEFPIERWHREALITPIWEGASNIQALDMLEAIFKKNAHKKLLKDFRNIVDEIKDGRDEAEADYTILNDSIEKLLKYSADEAQFYSKNLMAKMGNSMASILLIEIGNRTLNDRYITSGIMYYQRFVKNEDYGVEMIERADSIIHIDKISEFIKNR